MNTGCKRYIDKVCLITGGTRGIGLATAQRLLSEQAKAVFICSSQQSNVSSALNSFDKSDRIHGMQCDVTVKAQRLALLDKVKEMYGRLDVLILNQAVISHIGKQMEITEEKFD